MKKKLSILFISVLTLCLSACDFSFVPASQSSNNGNSQSTSQSSNSGSTPSSSSNCQSNSQSNSGSSNDDEEKIVNLEIYAFNDMHGNVRDSDTGLGLSKTTTLLKSRSTKNNTIFISQGDMWQGSAESNLTKGGLVTDWMNQNGFVSMTLGNHEFDWGQEYIVNNQAKADFPFLAINIYDIATNQRVNYCQPSTIIEKNGAKIGIIGAIGDCHSSISGSKVRDVVFKVGDELTNLVKAESTKLKQQGCDMIIYSIHDDATMYDLSLSGDYVDLVLEGHTHQNYHYLDDKGIYHIQGGGYNLTIPYINFDLNTKTNTIDVKSVRAIYTNDYVTTASNDTDTDALFTSYYDVIGTVHNPIGYNAIERYAEDLKQLCVDLYLQVGLEKWGTSYSDIFLAGGYISCRSPYYLPAGSVSYADIYTLFPFDNDVVLCTIPGYYLSRQFVNTENTNYFNAYTTYGQNNRFSINDNATYYIISDTYSSDYEPNHLTVVDTYRTDGYYARDLIRDYIAAGNFAN